MADKDPSRGVRVLRLALGSIEKSGRDLTMLDGVLRRRPPRSWESVEDALLEHLASVEDALAHVRRCRLYHEGVPDAPLTEDVTLLS